MTIKKHWTPRYLFAKANQYLYFKRNPNHPWLPGSAITFFEKILSKNAVGIEFGSGRSTAWLAKRVKFLYSIESNQNWYDIVRKSIDQNKIGNVEYRYKEFERNHASPYTEIYEEIEEESLDFIFVDGKNREICANMGIPKLKTGGWMIIDDVHRYLPSNSKTPLALGENQQIRNEIWNDFYQATKSWERTWLSNGISDTAFFQKK